MKFEVETCYIRCKALIHAMEKVASPDDKDTLMWVFEDEFLKLGEAIEKAQSKQL